jgi:hypothetical protein
MADTKKMHHAAAVVSAMKQNERLMGIPASLLFMHPQLIQQAEAAEAAWADKKTHLNDREFANGIRSPCMFMKLEDALQFVNPLHWELRQKGMAEWKARDENEISVTRPLGIDGDALILVVTCKAGSNKRFDAMFTEGHHRLLRLQELGCSIVPVRVDLHKVDKLDSNTSGELGASLKPYRNDLFDVPGPLFNRHEWLNRGNLLLADLGLPWVSIRDVQRLDNLFQTWDFGTFGLPREALTRVIDTWIMTGQWKVQGKGAEARLFSATPTPAPDKTEKTNAGGVVPMTDEDEEKAKGASEPEPNITIKPSSQSERISTKTKKRGAEDSDAGDRKDNGGGGGGKRGKEEQHAVSSSKGARPTVQQPPKRAKTDKSRPQSSFSLQQQQQQQQPQAMETSASIRHFEQQLIQVQPLEQARVICTLPRSSGNERLLLALYCALHMPQPIGTLSLQTLLSSDHYDANVVQPQAQFLRKRVSNSNEALQQLQAQIQSVTAAAAGVELTHQMPTSFAKLKALRGLQAESEAFLFLLCPGWKMLLNPSYAQQPEWETLRAEFLDTEHCPQTAKVVCLFLRRIARG